jgi:hypothetical protein
MSRDGVDSGDFLTGDDFETILYSQPARSLHQIGWLSESGRAVHSQRIYKSWVALTTLSMAFSEKP